MSASRVPQHVRPVVPDAGIAAARAWSTFAWTRWRGGQPPVPETPLDDAHVRTLGLAPLLYRALTGAGDVRAGAFAADYRHATTANLLRFAQAARVRDALARAGVPCVLLKGAAFLVRSARGDLGLRPMADVDLLVEPTQFAGAVSLLGTLGFRASGGARALSDRAAHAVSLVRSGGPIDVEIDLHRGLAHWPMHRGLTRDVLRTAVTVDGWHLPAPAEAIAIIAIHRARHAFIWSALDLVDLRTLVESVPGDAWPRCVDDLERVGALGAAWASLRQATYWLGPETADDARRLAVMTERLPGRRRRRIARIAPLDGPLRPPLAQHRPIDRHLRVLPAVYGSRLVPLAAAGQHLMLRLADEWRRARTEGGGWTTWSASVWHHLRGGAQRARARGEQA